MKINVINLNKSKQEEIEIRDDIFAIKPRGDIISRVVRWQLSKKQSGLHKVKSRSEVKSTSAKMFRQKGTGRARHGPNSVVQFRGGGVVHGPTYRSHAHKLPKKIRILGLKSALSIKAKTGNLKILEDQKYENKTSLFKKSLDKNSLSNFLLVFGKNDNDLKLGLQVRNLKNIDVISQIGLNVYDIIKKDKIVFTKIGIKEFEERLK